ncbi:MAG: Signal transduction histidine kinase CheA [Myxococcales bacterium]|nr:Signal transduction histidine kinase CheA [Myxococcales bacterium]
MTFPEDLVQQFRTVAVERIERVEAAWAQVLTSLNDAAAKIVHREIHTLKGESRIVGFTDVNMVCHKLEDLLELARARGYAVDEDFDLAVNMALRFMVMLIRKRVGTHLSGIDLPGFVRQIDNILKRHEPTGRSRTGSVPPVLRAVSTTRLPSAARNQLGPVAVDVFLEYAVSKAPRRDRLRTSWHAMRDLIGIQRAVVSTIQLGKYKPSVMALARDLGKELEVWFELDTAEVTTEILAAIDVSTLHLVRNAVDHGIESPAARLAAGKPAKGSIRLRGGMQGDSFVMTVEDDGRGIEFDRVRERAIELGLATENVPLTRERLVDLMCYPGFSTRTEANEVSGRGVGLDAVRGSAIDVGGTLAATSRDGQGTIWTLTIPVPPLVASGHVIRAPGMRFPIVVGPGWNVRETTPEMPIVVELGAALGLTPTNSINSKIWWFDNGKLQIGILCGGAPVAVDARRLVSTPPSALGEVVTIDSVEALLIRPDRIPGIVS